MHTARQLLARIGAAGGAVAIANSFAGSNSSTLCSPSCSARLYDVSEEKIVKRVIFVRHGEGFHNVAYETGGDGHLIFDAELTPRGIAEAQAIFTGTLASFKPEAAFVSPLWRTLQTCTHAFRARDDGHRCPIHAMEDVREHNHVSQCNYRRPISEAHTLAFPEVCFAALDADGPPPAAEWAVQMSYKSSMAMLRARAARVLCTLAARPEQSIVVFTHATFVRCVVAEVLGLGPHYYGTAPTTGTPTEVLLVENVVGDRYWRLSSGECLVEGVKPSAGWLTQYFTS